MADTPVAVAVAVAATTCLCLAARPSLTTYSCGPTDRFDARGFSTVNSIHLQRLQNTHHALCARYYNRLLRGLTVFNFDRPFRQSSENSCCCAALLGSISVSDRCCTRVVDGGSHLSRAIPCQCPTKSAALAAMRAGRQEDEGRGLTPSRAKGCRPQPPSQSQFSRWMRQPLFRFRSPTPT